MMRIGKKILCPFIIEVLWSCWSRKWRLKIRNTFQFKRSSPKTAAVEKRTMPWCVFTNLWCKFKTETLFSKKTISLQVLKSSICCFLFPLWKFHFQKVDTDLDLYPTCFLKIKDLQVFMEDSRIIFSFSPNYS